MSTTTKALFILTCGAFTGATLWAWQLMGDDIFITRVLAMASSCL